MKDIEAQDRLSSSSFRWLELSDEHHTVSMKQLTEAREYPEHTMNQFLG